MENAGKYKADKVGEHVESILINEKDGGKDGNSRAESEDTKNTRDTKTDGSNTKQRGKSKQKSKSKPAIKTLEGVAQEEPEQVEVFQLETDDEKPKKKQKKKYKTKVDKKKQLSDNILQITSVVANIHSPVWGITSEESDQLAEPISSILEEYDVLEKFGKYGNYISLIFVTLIIFLPRYLVYIDLKKAEKKGDMSYEQQQEKREDTGDSGKGNTKNTSNVAGDMQELLFQLPENGE